MTKLSAASYPDRLTFSWLAPTSTDLAGYKVYFNNSPTATPLPPDQTSFEQTGLTMATAYPLKVTTVNADANESLGVTLTASTLLTTRPSPPSSRSAGQ